MNHTPEIRRAIQFASRRHHGHMRMSKDPLPYVSHLFSAALMLAESDEDDEVVIAALLHDTIEDTGATKEEIAQAFGARVAEIVATVSEPQQEGERKLEWKERKKRYLAQLELGSDHALLVAVADKVDNIEDQIESIRQEGTDFLKHWNRPWSEYEWFYGAVLRMAEERLPKHPLTKRLAEAIESNRKLFS